MSTDSISGGNTIPTAIIRLDDEQRSKFARLAAEKACKTMTPETWEAQRTLSGDPLKADIDMIFDSYDQTEGAKAHD